MKRNSKFAVALAAVILLSSCMPVYSIHPFAAEKDMVFDPALLGTWYEEDDNSGKSDLVIEEMNVNGKRGYEITIRGLTDKPAVPQLSEDFDGRLFQLGGTRFLDMVQSEVRSGDEQLTVLAMPTHMVAELSLEGDTLQLHFLDDEWVSKNLKSANLSIAHETEDGTLVLTASTADLQQLLLAHANDEKAFSFDVGPLRRKT